ncbi:hypothetical protein [Gordonia aichiensis]
MTGDTTASRNWPGNTPTDHDGHHHVYVVWPEPSPLKKWWVSVMKQPDREASSNNGRERRLATGFS